MTAYKDTATGDLRDTQEHPDIPGPGRPITGRSFPFSGLKSPGSEDYPRGSTGRLHVHHHPRHRKGDQGRRGGGEAHIETLYPGSYFGEFALVDNMPRSASIIGVEDTEVFRLEKKDFDSLLARNLVQHVLQELPGGDLSPDFETPYPTSPSPRGPPRQIDAS